MVTLGSHAVAEDAPRTAAEASAAADAAEAAGDDARAYAQLSALRPGPTLTPAATAAIDARRDRLAARLAQTLLEQGAAQERDGQAVLAEKFYLQAVGYRAAAGDALERLWATPTSVRALGGDDEVARHRTRLASDESMRGLRWHLRQLPRTATREELDLQVARLERLETFAGSADGDLVTGLRLAARLGAGSLPSRDPASATRLAVLAARILPADDAAVTPLVRQQTDARRHAELARFGMRESAVSVRVGVWQAALSSRFSADATPNSPTATSVHQGSSASVSSSAPGLRVDVAWLRQPAPLGPRSGGVWGGRLSLVEAGFDTDLTLADPDATASSLNGARFASRIGITGIGVDAIGGWRWAVGSEESPWSLQAHGYAGAHMLRFSYGTRRNAITGGASEETRSTSGFAPEVGAEVEAAWRFTSRWAAIATLGYTAMWLPDVSSSRAVTFVDQTGTPTGTGIYDERFSGSTARGPVISIGLNASF